MSKGEPKRKKSRVQWRFRKRTIVFGLAMLVAGAGLFGYLWVKFSASTMVRVQQEIAALDDPNWRIETLEANRARVRDSENSALQIARVAALMPASWPRQKKVPSPSFQGGTAYEGDIAARTSNGPPDVALDRFLAAELRRELARLQPAIVEARLLAGMPLGRASIPYVPNPAAILLPHVDRSRIIARLLHCDVVLLSHDGQTDAALESCLAMLNTARSSGDEPFMTSQTARVSTGTRACSEIERVLAQGQASEAMLARIQDALIEEAGYSSLLVSLRGERATMNDEMEKLATGELDLMSIATDKPIPARSRFGMPAAFFQYNHALILDGLNRTIAIGKLPDSEITAAFQRLEESLKPPDDSFRLWAGALGRLYNNSALKTTVYNHLRYRAMLSCAIAIVACERHRLAHGNLPNSLDEVDPKFRAGLLGDPYVGGPLKFQVERNRIIVYSVGPDGKDDGGKQTGNSGRDPDLGLSLWRVSERRKSPRNDELPANVFQSL